MECSVKNWLGGFAFLLLWCTGAWGQALLPNGQQQFADANGAPLAGGLVYFYVPSTTTPKATWQDIGETTLNTNPVVLNAAGRATIWGTGEYREIVYDGFGNLIWDQITYGAGQAQVSTTGFGAVGTLAGASSTDLGSITSNNVLVTGSATISSFGSSASTSAPVFLVRFSGVSTLTYNATSMVLPGGKSITTAAGDTGIFVYLGSGNWYCYQYQAVGNSPLAAGFGAQVSVASAATTTLNDPAHNVLISGGTTITSFGSAASLAQPLYLLQFSGALSLTHNATSLILPGATNITTAAGDSALALYLGSGNWQVLFYKTKAGSPLSPVLKVQSFTASGSFTVPSTATTSTPFEFICQGPGAGGGSNSGGNGGGGGGGGAGAYDDVVVSGFTPGSTVTVTVGTGGAGSSSSASNGSDGSGPTKFTYSAVDFLSCGQGLGGVSGVAAVTNLGGAGGTVTTNYAGAGLTLQTTVLHVDGQSGGSGKYQGSSIAQSGAGGSTPIGQGGPSAHSIVGTFTTGQKGNGFGAGSAGGVSGDTTQSNAQDGASGFAEIRWIGQ